MRKSACCGFVAKAVGNKFDRAKKKKKKKKKKVKKKKKKKKLF
jgi:hypothetical protein